MADAHKCLRSSTAGKYFPAFFEMRLNHIENIDLNNCSDAELSVIFHEYVHFLQDLTTTYGLTNCYYVGEYIQSVVSSLTMNSDFPLPYQFSAEKESEIDLMDKIRNITYGNSDSVEKISITDVYLDCTKTGSDIGPREIIGVVIEGKNDIILSFGACAIMESMAFILERLATRDYSSAQDFPYSTAELVVEHIYPDFGKNVMNVLALCDCCLMFTNPAEVFYKTLQQMKEKNYLPTHPQDLYNQLKNAKIGVVDYRTDIFSHYRTIAEQAKEKFKSYFYSEDGDLHIPYQKWIDKIFDYAIRLRTSNPHYLIDVALCGYLRENPVFDCLIKQLGTPLIRNKKKEYYSFNPIGHEGFAVEIFGAILQIYCILRTGNPTCGLFPWCKETEGINPTVEICLHKPWERCDMDRLCPFALIWKNWGLSAYSPYLADSKK